MFRILRPRTALIVVALLAASSIALADTVIPDDLIVQGSACIGLDCVNNESFGFDTIRLKENNTRIHFMDTSTSPGFPNHNWQLTANDSASGGLNKFSIEDLTAATVPFTILGSAPTNSIFVAASGKVGLRTSTPVLDLQITTGDTPAQRLEQTSSGGFTAQTWDIAGNEANFFVRDVTSGSRLPFRIRPGAPTSSIDIAATGNVGVGTASPGKRLSVSTPTNGDGLEVGGVQAPGVQWTSNSGNAGARNWGMFSNYAAFGDFVVRSSNALNGDPYAAGTTNLSISSAGVLAVPQLDNCSAGVKTLPGGIFQCMPSSAQFKLLAGALAPQTALANVMALRPQTGAYKDTPDVPEHWLIAEDVAQVDPALVGLRDGKPFTVKTQNVVADLILVVQQQQRRIDELERQLRAKN